MRNSSKITNRIVTSSRMRIWPDDPAPKPDGLGYAENKLNH